MSMIEVRESGRSSVLSPQIEELVAIGAAIASNCEPCLKFHYDQARKLGVSDGDMGRAVAIALMVKDTPARAMVELAGKLLGDTVTPASQAPCRASTGDTARASTGSCCS